MKVTIEYEFDPNGYYAFYKDEQGSKVYFCSMDSFEKAKSKLMEYLSVKDNTIIPQPEEIEL